MNGVCKVLLKVPPYIRNFVQSPQIEVLNLYVSKFKSKSKIQNFFEPLWDMICIDGLEQIKGDRKWVSLGMYIVHTCTHTSFQLPFLCIEHSMWWVIILMVFGLLTNNQYIARFTYMTAQLPVPYYTIYTIYGCRYEYFSRSRKSPSCSLLSA